MARGSGSAAAFLPDELRTWKSDGFFLRHRCVDFFLTNSGSESRLDFFLGNSGSESRLDFFPTHSVHVNRVDVFLDRLDRLHLHFYTHTTNVSTP
ncbi:hypothetical protein Zmor_001938 [Zophobas morio]|uniref:Uncharacterized protein n=1 Tax=Zophobas morio TaxID=2755281 RepID=A0AA38J586_9CUCU|nr:hypothetical protein Zmor_021492 [Zophobas morio]KAJ3666499.1 hypothetical protein Zmor_001938 [Zophobas morio]